MAFVTSLENSLPVRMALSSAGNNLTRSLKRLSTGLRVKSAADAPADVSIAKRAGAHISALNQAASNLQDAVSMMQTQDAGLAQIQSIVHRIRDIALKAANDAVISDRDALNDEVAELKNTINDIAYGSKFNGKELLIGNPIQDIKATTPVLLANPGTNPSWSSDGSYVSWESNRLNGARYPSVNAWRIWRVPATPGAATQLTPDPANAPLDADGDGFVNHPLSDLYDAQAQYPGAGDSDGDGWPDPIDTHPANPLYPGAFTDGDGDGYINHPWIDAADADPTLPEATDADGDGFVDHPWMEPDDANPNIPDPAFDGDGDGEIDYYDPWPANPLQSAATPPDGDGDGWPSALDPDDGDPFNPGGAPADGDGDGTIDFYDPWAANPLANPANPLDTDADTIPDDFDPAPAVNNNSDGDGDGILDIFDPLPANPAYPTNVDGDGDGYPDDGPGLFDPAPGNNQYPTNTDTDLDGTPDVFDPAPGNNTIPGPFPGDLDGDGFVDHALFDMDDTDPLVPFDKFTDVDGDKYPWYIDGGPGTPGGDDTNPYMPLASICYEDHDPEWSGGGLAFSSNRNTYYTAAAAPYITDIFVYSGTTVYSITNDANDDTQPAWSGDDRALAWTRDGDIYTISMNGAQAVGAPSLVSANGGAPVWDPNSDTVYFTRGGDIYYAGASGGAGTPLTTGGTIISGDNPAFLSSGDALIYSRGGGVYFYNFRKGLEGDITGVFAGADEIDISPDMTYMAYTRGGLTVRNTLEITYEPGTVQAGASSRASDRISVDYADGRIGSLGIAHLSVSTQSDALAAVDLSDAALDEISQLRAQIGSNINIFNSQIQNHTSGIMNTSAFAANITDADMAAEVTNYTTSSMLANTAAAQLALSSETVLSRARALLDAVTPGSTGA